MVYLLSALVALILSLFIVPAIRRIAIANKIVDQPGGRRIHKEPVPRMGGVAVVLSFWIVVLGVAYTRPDLLHFTGETIGGIDKNLLGVFVGSMILMFTGIVDDARGLSPVIKLLAQFAAAACVPLFGIHIQWLANPIGGLDIQLPLWIDTALITLWIVGIINVVNWLDGLDGLATGVSSIAAFILFFLSLAPFVNQPATALLAIVLVGSGLGFLKFNINPAKIFLGDSGSMFFGYMIAILAVISGGKLATAGLVLGIPILDAAWVILRRVFSGQSPWVADRRHLHHRLLDAGLTQKQTVTLYWALSAIFGSIALASRTYGKTIAAVTIFGLMIVIGLGLVLFDRYKNKLTR